MYKIKSKSVLFFLSLSAVVSQGCKKDNKEDLSGNYTLESKINLSAIRMFTNGGEITDKHVISSYVTRKNLASDFISNKSPQTYDPGAYLKFELDNKVSVTLKNTLFGTVTKKAEIISRTKSDVLIAYVDTTFADSIVNSPFDKCRFIPEAILKFKKRMECKPLSITTLRCGYRDLLPLTKKGKDLFVPVLDYHVSVKTQVNNTAFLCSASSREINIFNQASITELGINDTLIIQQKEVKLIKQ